MPRDDLLGKIAGLSGIEIACRFSRLDTRFNPEGSMRQMNTRMWAIAVASSLLSSTAMLGAQDRDSMASVADQPSRGV